MRMTVTLTLDVDTDAWTQVYGIDGVDVSDDVHTYILEAATYTGATAELCYKIDRSSHVVEG